MSLRPLLAVTAALLLTGCGDEPKTTGNEAGVTEEAPVAAPTENEKVSAEEETVLDADGMPEGTPMAERVATIGLLNKRNNLTQDIKLKPGEQERVGDVLIKVATCERRPPWDPEPEEGAFVQVYTTDEPDDDEPKWKRIFSGWLFVNSPSLNVVENPIYDVWVKDCAMRFPGEEEAANAAKASGKEE